MNVYAAPNQLDVPILAWGNEAIIRTVVWSTEPVTEAEPRWPLPIQDPVSGRQDLYERLVWVPDTDVILYLHGHSSRAEEGENLAKQLIADAKKRNRRLSVVAFDWPNCGYSSHLHPAQIGKQLPIDTKQGHNFFALDYYDEVVKQLVGQMHLEGRLLAVVGGSLGGNMVLRLAQQRARAENPWIRNLVAWNPAGAWSSYYFDPFKEAGALPRVRVRVEQEDNGLERRREYFEQVYASDVWIFGVPIAKKKIDQSDHWYRQDWLPCRDNLRVTSMLDRVEIYNTRFRTWHWRMAFEQLVISHLENDCAEFCPPQGKEPWRSMRGPLLLLDGKDDPDLHKPTVELAGKLASVRGMTGAHRTVNATGHSIHDERPAWLSGTILDFCPARR
ncbi:alpha/beta hydrolase [Terrabacter sp. NPDC000476]|uniref:alpha/beta hydrolase n=1 Tax=Terrabacter sp. NPDC000476 TaxID=3154258 RepID=UPI00331AC835